MAAVGRGLGMMAAGFGGACMYENQGTVRDVVGGLAKGISYLPAPKATPSSQADLSHELAAITALSDQVARLSAEVGRIVAGGYHRSGSDSSSRSYGWIIGVPAAAGLGWLAMRLAGASFGDVAWVTQHTYKRAMVQVQGSVAALQERLAATRQALQQQLDRLVAGQEASSRDTAALRNQVAGVSSAQEQLRREMGDAHGALRSQVAAVEEALGDQVAGVGGELERVAAGVDALRGSVRRVEFTLQAVEESQQYSRQGIQMLCGVVSDAMEASSRSQPAVLELRPPARPSQSLMPAMAWGGVAAGPASSSTSGAGSSTGRGVLADLAKVQNLMAGPGGGSSPEAVKMSAARLRGVGAATLSSPTR